MKKSTAVQSQRVTRHGAEYWAEAFGLLLTIALVSPAPAQPLPQVEGFIFDSGEIEAVSISEGSINTAAPEPAHAAYSDRQAIANHRKAAPLLGMETEPFAAAAVSGKWSRARAEIARELDIVARCHGSGDQAGIRRFVSRVRSRSWPLWAWRSAAS